MQTTNRVAINTIIQYVKLVVNVLVGLISVRILLNALGADDYGIYDVVGGIIAFLAFINSSLSQSSMRFLSVSLGKRDIYDTQRVFNDCFWIHLLVSVIIVFLFEILGPFLFDRFLVIPESRLSAAKIVYHFMIFILFLQIAITPFNALIVSHEKFVYTSAIAILDSFLKLGIAFVVKFSSTDKLIVYGGLMAGVTLLNSLLSILYIIKNYKQEVFLGKISFRRSKELLSFVGWTVMDIISQLSTRQGYAIMFNRFSGTATNAVYALSRQIEGNLYYLSASVIDSIKPQIMKSYGEGNMDRMIRLSLTAGKIGFSMLAVIAIPLMIMMPSVLELWLVNVPYGTIFFARMMVLACLIEQLTRGLVYSCQATGKIKLFSIIVSLIRFSALPLSIVAFICGCEAKVAMIIYVFCESLGAFSRVLIMSKITELNVCNFISSVLFKIIPPVLVTAIVSFLLYQYNREISFCVVNFMQAVLVYSCLSYLITLDSFEKTAINKVIKSSIAKFSRKRI